ncbi:hypothetical protein QWY85_14705 [Neolewinella lacunae]|uniref:DNA primase n=1 Tax=Neolewinella lacunae TaxID=1517758 RepID=A0A923PM75_9BACT|nr:hypothetical protein [Neolewinella lacunae]MBC6993097.1 hypothetical protein [Neolewinella lacunae]MDN3635917.1 hypothetical protein [Neolewinella lacunae]
MSKPRVIKNYEKVDEALLEQIKLKYPEGFASHLIRFTDVNGRLSSALPFETEEKYYLIRMTKSEAVEIIADDDDYDEDGNLLDEVREEYAGKYDDDDDFDAADIDPDEIADDDVGGEDED